MTAPRPCSIADALEVVGEKYSLLVLREILFGVRRFEAMVHNVGAPRDVLAARLRRLVAARVLEKVPYSQRPPRFEYRLTDAGRELRPVLLMLMAWGDRHLAEDPPVVFEHSCGADLEPTVVCRGCGQSVVPGFLTPRFTTPGQNADGPVSATGRPDARPDQAG
jgi:DNA-binding HxlR family transcriptional regulator